MMCQLCVEKLVLETHECCKECMDELYYMDVLKEINEHEHHLELVELESKQFRDSGKSNPFVCDNADGYND